MYRLGVVTAAGDVEVCARRSNRIGLAAEAQSLSKRRRVPVVVIWNGSHVATEFAPGLSRAGARMPRAGFALIEGNV